MIKIVILMKLKIIIKWLMKFYNWQQVIILNNIRFEVIESMQAIPERTVAMMLRIKVTNIPFLILAPKIEIKMKMAINTMTWNSFFTIS